MKFLSKQKTIYEEFDRNFEDISNYKLFKELPLNTQIEELENNQKIIDATPGRNEIIMR